MLYVDVVKQNSLHVFSGTPFTSWQGLLITWLVLLFGLAFYRLYLSPISHFPGPRLAALTKWYEFYYEVLKRGQFSFQIQDLHRRYGEPSSGPDIDEK